ncbi:unnamed protein product [Haemonchus placei]|uniref:Uncharacterized protein n=1 Tax=Haemonchus placei TaxID=6290 RepID=A0A3P8AZ32_HAEPC|nr:unnamed protein product [Haemonchus placei]
MLSHQFPRILREQQYRICSLQVQKLRPDISNRGNVPVFPSSLERDHVDRSQGHRHRSLCVHIVATLTEFPVTSSSSSSSSAGYDGTKNLFPPALE